MKQTTLILIFLCLFYSVQAQVFNNVPPSISPPSPNIYKPFTNNNRPMLRAIDPDDDGDPFGGTGGNDGKENLNDNNIPVRDGVWLSMLAALAYAVISVVKIRKINKTLQIHTHIN